MFFLVLSSNGCSYCKVPPECLGKYGEEYHIRLHGRYRKIIQDGGLGDPEMGEKELNLRIKQIMGHTGLKLFPLEIWRLKDTTPYELFATNTLDCIWIGVFSHLMGWVIGFLKKN